MSDTNIDDSDRKAFISVAVSLRNRSALTRLGSSFEDIRCPECGHSGTRFGDYRNELDFDGFTPRSGGGPAGMVCRCNGCQKDVILACA